MSLCYGFSFNIGIVNNVIGLLVRKLIFVVRNKYSVSLVSVFLVSMFLGLVFYGFMFIKM